jgi:hypothetical protein
MTDADPLTRACELVGRFLYHFSRVEEQLDEAITKLFKLNLETAKIVTVNIDFNRKRYIVHSAVNHQNSKALKPIADVDATFNDICKENNARQVVAHSAFEADASDGVKFERIVAKKELKSVILHWTENDFRSHFEALGRLEAKLVEIVNKLEPDRIVWPTSSLFIGTPTFSEQGSPPVLLRSPLEPKSE